MEEVALLTDIDNYNAEAEAVVLMTLHSAKGLEFPIVFIPGMEEGVFPGVQSMYIDDEVERNAALPMSALRVRKKNCIFPARNPV